MNRSLRTIALGSLFTLAFGGCASKPYSPLKESPSSPSLASVPLEPEPEVIVLPQEPAAVIGLDNVDAGMTPPVLMTNNVPAPSGATTFGRGWILLRTWAERCALGAPSRVVSGGVTTYRVPARAGICTFTIGSRLAHFNGIAVWLGFPPQIVRGEPYIHALDAEKTMTPLAEMSPSPTATARTVVLDPGHGGSDAGTRGAHNEMEKTYTLDWALRAERLLTNAGWKVFLTRRSDAEIPLLERVAFADRARANLFVSLHFNSTFPQTQPSGVETYCLTPSGMPSTLARGYADDERAIFPNNSFDKSNSEWAFRIHRAMLGQTHARDDGMKRARFMGVLRYQQRPAVLVEGGFLSNRHEAANIQSPAYRESLAKALVEALK